MAAPKVEFRALEQLTKDPENARTHSAEQVGMIRASIERFGWTYPMLVDDVIRAGNGRYDAAAAIYADGGTIYMFPGKAHGGAKVPRGQVPLYDCSGWPEAMRVAYALADNRIPEMAGWDFEQVEASLAALTVAEFPMADMGFDEAALEAMARAGSDEGGSGMGREPGAEIQDSDYRHVDQYGVIVMCADEAEQEAVFTRLRDEGLSVKVVVV